MGDTYVKAHFHLIFAVKYRQAIIQKEWKDDLEKYITSIVQSNGHKLLAVGGVSDHIHLFLGYNLNQKIPDLVNNIKTYTSHWINREKLSKSKFNWQNGYGAFTHSYSNIDRVVKYVLNQEEHHKKLSFKEEYVAFLKKYDLEFETKYLFDFFDD